MRRIWSISTILWKSRKIRQQIGINWRKNENTWYSTEAGKYEKKSPLEHVLLRPDTYIGGVGIRESHSAWIFDRKSRKMIRKCVSYPPGLLKIFDEILVNAADNKARDDKMTKINVEIDKENGRISVWNNGKGLPVEIHPVESVYVPTMVFGSLFTSSNYDDNEIKVVGGRNGYGAKLCNIFSKEFTVETVDTKRRLKFRQKWSENMRKCDEPIIEKSDEKAEDYTKIEFIADLSRFNINHFSDDIESLIEKRVHDVAATLPNDVTVSLNGEKINIKGFEEYVRSFLPNEKQNHVLFLHPTNRWHVAIAKRKIENENGEDTILPSTVSFVNNINTEKGGTHIDYVLDKIIAVIKKEIDEKIEKNVVKPMMIKNNLSIFVNCLIENPSFESQTKETLTTKPKFFGSTFEFDSEKLKKWAETSGLIDEIIEQTTNLKKTRKGGIKKSKENVRDILKLEDAAWAGLSGGKAEKCTLIITEGDSAKALALAGLEILGRETFGVFPLKGKLVNVSMLDEKKAKLNEEIANLMKIIGLEIGKIYEPNNRNELRYGKIMILADQDEDGAHIKGLIINFIHKFWPELIRNGFVKSFRTPLLKAKKSKEILSFFSNQEYRKWAESNEESSKYAIKYYKGLGTSTSNEAREYFSNLDHHLVEFEYNDSTDDEAIRMAFDRDKSEKRKKWIEKFEENQENSLEMPTKISFKQFIDSELIRFGIVDLRRSIPCLIDGLKPSQRKILWTLMQKDEIKEIKVSQLAGAVSHDQSYHHGEESLVRTIVRMGQQFVGSSNLAILQPLGQFGTRHEGGQDAASARYIYTKLGLLTRNIFPQNDDILLEKRIEDGIIVEPKWLCPIIPMILVNGAEGIGTGWSTKILNRNLFKIIDSTRKSIEKIDIDWHKIEPFYEGNLGTIEKSINNRYLSKGKIELMRPERKNSSTFQIEIQELPIGVWTSKYKEKLGRILKKMDGIQEYSEFHSEKNVKFRIVFDRKLNQNLLKKTNRELIEMFKLESSLTENLVLFNSKEKLREFQNIGQIFLEYFEVRQKMYEKRLEIMKRESENKLEFIENQIKFINFVTDGTIDLRQTNRDDLIQKLIKMNFKSDPIKNPDKSDFSYLLEMPLSRLTPDEMFRLTEKRHRRKTDLDQIAMLNWQSTWQKELDRLEIASKRVFKN